MTAPQSTPARKSIQAPLYSEFGRWSDTASWAADVCWVWFFGAALITTALSYVANAANLELIFTEGQKFTPEGGVRAQTLLFGYWSELNAAPTYLFIVPLVLLFSCRFVSNLDAGLESLVKTDRLRFTGDPAAAQVDSGVGEPKRSNWVGRLLGLNNRRPSTALEAIAYYNRRAWPPLLAILMPLIVCWVIVTTERNFWDGGDYEKLAFGYVQAAHFPSDPDDVPLAEFERITGREVKPIKGIDDKANWWVHKVSGGPVGSYQRAAFFCFVTLHIALECCFTIVGVWIILKILFMLGLTARAILHRGSLVLDLNHRDETHRFGCGVLDRCWPQLMLAVSFFILIGEFSFSTNMAKGSWRPPGVNAPLSAVIGQGWVRWEPLALVTVIFLYFSWLYLHADRLTREAVRDNSSGSAVADQQLFVTGKMVATFMTAVVAALVRLLPPDAHSPLGDIWSHLFK